MDSEIYKRTSVRGRRFVFQVLNIHFLREETETWRKTVSRFGTVPRPTIIIRRPRIALHRRRARLPSIVRHLRRSTVPTLRHRNTARYLLPLPIAIAHRSPVIR